MKSRDLFVAMVLVAHPELSTIQLSKRIGISTSQIHYAKSALRHAGLLNPEGRVQMAALLEFLEHGVKYIFPVRQGVEALGIPTGIAPPNFAEELAQETPFVWATPAGTQRGPSIAPLFKKGMHAVSNDPVLYKLLTAVDALRGRSTRSRKIAADFLRGELLS